MADRKVYLKNMVNGKVVVNKPSFGIKRVWVKRNQTMAIPYEIVEQLLWDSGFKNMIDTGILYIEDMQTKIDLGLEPVGATEPENIIALTETQMKELMTTTPISVFKRKVSDLTKVQIDNLVSYAVENELTDSEKCKFIKDLTKKDIFKAISQKQDVEAAEAAERAGK